MADFADDKALAQEYLRKHGNDAWGTSRQDRDKNERHQYSESLRNAEHYLYAHQYGSDSLTDLAKMHIMTLGYSAVKATSNGLGHVSEALGGTNFSPWRGSPATLRELRAGIAGANDGYREKHNNDEAAKVLHHQAH